MSRPFVSIKKWKLAYDLMSKLLNAWAILSKDESSSGRLRACAFEYCSMLGGIGLCFMGACGVAPRGGILRRSQQPRYSSSSSGSRFPGFSFCIWHSAPQLHIQPKSNFTAVRKIAKPQRTLPKCQSPGRTWHHTPPTHNLLSIFTPPSCSFSVSPQNNCPGPPNHSHVHRSMGPRQVLHILPNQHFRKPDRVRDPQGFTWLQRQRLENNLIFKFFQ